MNTLDARTLPLLQKMSRVLQEVSALQHGQSLIIINDIDPKPLKLKLGKDYTWEYLQSTLGEYIVKITKI